MGRGSHYGVGQRPGGMATVRAYYIGQLGKYVPGKAWALLLRSVLIRGPQQHGFYPTRDEALLEGFRRFGRVSFLVKQVLLQERPRPLAGVIL